MRHAGVLVFALAVICGSFLAAVPMMVRAQSDSDAAQAAEAAREISRLEAVGDYDAIYDRMHPDGRAIIPRAAVVGWYQDGFAERQTAELTVTDVRFVDWTWPVTGKTYADTAEVEYVQPFWEDGEQTEVTDTVRLVKSESGWGWFFGRSTAFVDEQIARYGGSETVSDAEAAAEAARELSRLEAARDFNAVYDRIHPDVHAVVPRAAVVGWYEETFADKRTAELTVTGVRFVAWSWPVTGQTYPNTAEVSFTQPFWEDGEKTEVNDVIRLVKSDGGWRWFFGRSKEFVDEQIAKFAPRPPSGTLPERVSADVNTFWTQVFDTEGRSYVSPRLVGYSLSLDTDCGRTPPPGVSPAGYCALDETIYYDTALLPVIVARDGDFAWSAVIAHEWGHHIQHELGIRRSEDATASDAHSSREIELQADCLGGVYAQDADTRGLLGAGDITEAVRMSAIAGDPPGMSSSRRGHGSSDDRVTAFMRGYLDGVTACGLPL